MPKIIENLPERLAEEARRQIEESGFASMTIRSVAKSCGVGVGTVYNYYSSKEALVATFMLSDWKACIADIQNCADTAGNAETVLRAVSEKLQLFMKQYDPIFRDEAASGSYTGSTSQYHSVLRDQLASPIRKFCTDDFTAQFVAEAMLTWTVAGKPFPTLFDVVSKLF